MRFASLLRLEGGGVFFFGGVSRISFRSMVLSVEMTNTSSIFSLLLEKT